jgi:hypothetical protein
MVARFKKKSMACAPVDAYTARRFRLHPRWF